MSAQRLLWTLVLSFFVYLTGTLSALPSPAPESSTRAIRSPDAQCPLLQWRGVCRYMTESQKAQIRVALETHVHAAPKCLRAKAALLAWIDDWKNQSWTFSSHGEDDGVGKIYVFGQTARHTPTGEPAAFGLRDVLFRSHAAQLARVALHEGAHLMGEGEQGASRIEHQCITP